MCFRITAPFLVSTRPLSPLCRAGFGLFDQQLVEQLGDGAVDELAAVVGVKALDAKWGTARSMALETGSR